MRSVIHCRPFSRGTEVGRINYGLCYRPGNASPYFTVTVEGRDTRFPRDGEFGGCCHELVIEVAPDLAPLVALHLSDVHGAPMHAESNGWYWLAGAIGGAGQQYHGANAFPKRSADECLALFASHVRVSLDEARAIAERAAAMDPKEARENFRTWCLLQAPRWQDEARAAVAAFNLEGWQS